MHELFQAGVKKMGERSELISCNYIIIYPETVYAIILSTTSASDNLCMLSVLALYIYSDSYMHACVRECHNFNT